MDTSTPSVAALVNRQWAVIRALTDEVQRCCPSDFRVAALREQLRDEEKRLAEALADPAAV